VTSEAGGAVEGGAVEGGAVDDLLAGVTASAMTAADLSALLRAIEGDLVDDQVVAWVHCAEGSDDRSITRDLAARFSEVLGFLVDLDALLIRSSNKPSREPWQDSISQALLLRCDHLEVS
jgi:hypothetical protein